MPMPTFLIIGAQKSGTTALYHALRQHPQIYLSPIKEPGFFAFEGHPLDFVGPHVQTLRRYAVTTFHEYQKLFSNGANAQAIGEASTIYLSWYRTAETAARIYHYISNVRLIAILRQPAERAYSAHAWSYQMGQEQISDFSRAIEPENSPVNANRYPDYRYVENGFYFRHLQPYYQLFSPDQIRIYLYDDWRNSPEAVLRSIFRFLEVTETITPAMLTERNTSFHPRSHTLHRLLRHENRIKPWLKWLLPAGARRILRSHLSKWNRGKRQPMPAALRATLTERYREDIRQLQTLLRRDLSGWLE